MNIAHLLTLPCEIVSVADSGPADIYGNPTEQTTVLAAKCWVTGRRPSEQTGGADWQTETVTIFFPAGTVIDGGDRVTVRSATYEVVGPPAERIHPRTGRVEFVHVTARRAF